MRRIRIATLGAALLFGMLAAPTQQFAIAQTAAPAAQSEAALTRTQIFELPSFTFQNGRTLKNLKIGYETHGRLSAAGDNVIFLPRSYSANSRIAARIAPADAAPAVWDSLIGPGKMFDTNRFFVVGSSSLGALPTGDSNTVTTGPASINPDTGRAYGADFPVFTIRDMVEVDRALLQSLGVKRIHTLFGVSMGSMQGFEWTVSHPDFVERHIALLPMPEADGFTVSWMNVWSAPILSDPNWNGGNYHGAAQPTAGTIQALNIIHLHQRNRAFAAREGRAPAAADKTPMMALANGFQAEAGMTGPSTARSRIFDPASIVLGARAMALFSPGGKATLDEAFAPVKAKTLLIPAKSDILFFPAYAQRARDSLLKLGKKVEYFEIDGEGGHFDGIFNLRQAADVMAKFVAD
jgi:homoserine O-acetyltransferase/O-succinyltransferase